MCAANLEGLTADAVAVTVGGWGGHLVRWKKLNITSLSSVATADRPERSGPAAPGEGAAFKKTKNRLLLQRRRTSGRRSSGDLHEKFPDSRSRASHVRSAAGAGGRRPTMAHTWKTERGDTGSERRLGKAPSLTGDPISSPSSSSFQLPRAQSRRGHV